MAAFSSIIMSNTHLLNGMMPNVKQYRNIKQQNDTELKIK